MSNIDLEQVSLNLMNTAEHVSNHRLLQERVMIDFTKEAYGWGREMKFQK